MRADYGMRNRQRGVAAVIMGIAAIALFAFMGIAVDLAYTYSRKTELMNAADAAALSGAKELNEKLSGVTGTGLPCTSPLLGAGAINRAICTFNQNNTNNLVGSAFVITVANLRLGSCPNPDDRLPLRSPSCTFVAASSITTDAAAGGKTFLEVSTPTHTRNTFFMAVTGGANLTTDTYGYAVAGRFVNDVTPIGVCAIDPVNKTSKYTGTNELVESGFRRGVTYNMFGLNPLAGAPSDPYLVNPVDAPPGACNPAHSSAAFTAPFICNGSSAIVSGGAASVYTNTGMTASLAASLNSRFDDYSGPSACVVASAPPDSNVKQYPCSPNGNPACINAPPAGSPSDWMGPNPDRESVDINPNPASPGAGYVGNPPHKPVYSLPPPAGTATTPNTPPPATNNPGPFAPIHAAGSAVTTEQYGVLWSYGPAYTADASVPPKAGTPFSPFPPCSPGPCANGSVLYNNTAVNYFDTTNYPTTLGTGFPAGTPPAPYNQTAGNYFQAPPTHPPGTRNRRVLNLVLVDCRNAPVGPASCGVMPIVGVGKFFMQIPADFTGGPSNRRLMVEFAGLIQPVPVSEIKLYR
jgi:putative Flp pilus-assembly TadE/G-like protein